MPFLPFVKIGVHVVNEDWTVKSSHFLTSSTPYYSYSVYSYNEVLSTDLGKTKILEMFGNFMLHLYISRREVWKIVLVFLQLGSFIWNVPEHKPGSKNHETYTTIPDVWYYQNLWFYDLWHSILIVDKSWWKKIGHFYFAFIFLRWKSWQIFKILDHTHLGSEISVIMHQIHHPFPYVLSKPWPIAVNRRVK